MILKKEEHLSHFSYKLKLHEMTQSLLILIDTLRHVYNIYLKCKLQNVNLYLSFELKE